MRGTGVALLSFAISRHVEVIRNEEDWVDPA
jgi:hypothetical protein